MSILQRSWGRFLCTPPKKDQILYMIPWDNLVDFYHATSESTLNERTTIKIRDQLRGDFEGQSCCSFTEAARQRFFEMTGCIATERYGSTTTGIEYLRIGKAPELPTAVQALLPDIAPMLDHPFEVQRFDGNGRGVFAAIASRLLGPILQRKIILNVPHGHSQEYSPRGAFQIHIWSTPHHHLERAQSLPRSIWGVRVGCDDSAFGPKELHQEGSVLIRDGKYIVAELLENALYVHHDLVHYGRDYEFELFAKLLEKAAEQLAGTERWEELRREAQEAFAKRQRETFAAFVQKGIPQRASRHEAAVKTARQKADEARTTCMEAERELFNLQQAVNDPKMVAERFEEEFTRLSDGSLDGVVSLTLHEHDGRHHLTVRTTELTAHNRNTGKNHLLGHFEITLYLDDGSVRFTNLDRTFKGYDAHNQHAPHVYQSGRPCLGNIETELATYIAHYELEAAIGLSIAFLQTGADDGDPLGRVIHSFPEVNHKTTKGVAA